MLTSVEDFQTLAESRLREAKVLLAKKEWDGAYYLAGYSIEFALKAVIVAAVIESKSFPEKKLTEQFYGHDLSKLLFAARLNDRLDEDSVVPDAWKVVKDWSEQCRYEFGKDKKSASDLIKAIQDTVLP